MFEFFGSIWWLIVTLGILVTFHEFGHFWVARRCGVKVLRFSVGFGRAIWSHTARSGTEYCIAMIPLGGYVKMLDAREGDVPDQWRHAEFTQQPIWKRIVIVIAGPGFNFIFAVFAFWLMFMVGRPGVIPTLAAPSANTLAAQAGFQANDRIETVNGAKVATWSTAMNALSESILAHKPAKVEVKQADGTSRTRVLAFNTLPSDLQMDKAFDKTGLKLKPLHLPPVIAKVQKNSPAAKAGLKSGDRINAIDGVKVNDFRDIGHLINQKMEQASSLTFTITRQGHEKQLTIAPKWIDASKQAPARWIIGIMPKAIRATTLVRYGPVKSLGKAFANTWDKTAMTFSMIGNMITGEVSTRNLSGIITIARFANTSAQMGVAWFLSFLGLVSLSLAVLNLLPIPILDGGHLLYYLIELLKGSPVSEGTMVVGQYIGLTVVVALMGLALYNDFLRLIP